jgi:hypothetical protein
MNSTRSLTAEHLEPWNGNIVDVTMADGSHLTGLLQRVDDDWVRLGANDGSKTRPGTGLVRISETVKVGRAERN